MKDTLGFVGAAVVLTLSLAAPVPAQERGAHGGGGGGERHNSTGGGGGGGSAVERGGGGGGAMSAGGSGGGFSGASSGSGGAAGGGFGTGPSTAGAVGRVSTSHPGPSPLGHAAFRDRDGARLDNDGGRRIVFSGPMSAADPSVDPATRAIPPGSRPNHRSPSIGTAIERSSLPSGGSGGGAYDYYYNYYTTGYFGGLYNYYSRYGMLGYYSPYALFSGGSWYYPFDPDYLYGYGAFGIGSFYYDPMWWGGGYGGGGGYSKGESTGPKGGLKLRVTPDTAAVYVDGTYYGIVDQFNSAFQRLELPVGAHHIELQAKGYQSLAFEVSIDRNDTVSYRGTMTPSAQK